MGKNNGRLSRKKQRIGEMIRYLVVGILSTVVSLGSYYLLVFTILNPEDPIMLQLANIISWIAAVTFAFFTNRSIVFRSKNKNIINEAVKFYISRVLTLCIEMAFMFVVVSLCGVNDKIAKIIAQIIVIIVNYITSKVIVFKNKQSN